MVIIVIHLLMEKKSISFNSNENAKFSTRFCLGSISDGYHAT